MTGGEKKSKFDRDRRRLDLVRMGRLANSLYYTPMLGIGLENLEPVNRKGEGSKQCTATTTSWEAASAEVAQPRPDEARQRGDMTA